MRKQNNNNQVIRRRKYAEFNKNRFEELCGFLLLKKWNWEIPVRLLMQLLCLTENYSVARRAWAGKRRVEEQDVFTLCFRWIVLLLCTCVASSEQMPARERHADCGYTWTEHVCLRGHRGKGRLFLRWPDSWTLHRNHEDVTQLTAKESRTNNVRFFSSSLTAGFG